MQFFVPESETLEKSLEEWEAIKQHCEDYTQTAIQDTKIYSLVYFNDGNTYSVKVGEEHPENGEIVQTIFESDAYLTCTHNRGVKAGEPIMVGNVSGIEEFE